MAPLSYHPRENLNKQKEKNSNKKILTLSISLIFIVGKLQRCAIRESVLRDETTMPVSLHIKSQQIANLLVDSRPVNCRGARTALVCQHLGLTSLNRRRHILFLGQLHQRALVQKPFELHSTIFIRRHPSSFYLMFRFFFFFAPLQFILHTLNAGKESPVQLEIFRVCRETRERKKYIRSQ